jgi:hypothetical protein
MHKRPIAALAGSVAILLAAVAAMGVASAPAAQPASCDVSGDWAGDFAGQLPGNQGSVIFDITTDEDDDPPEPFEKDKNVKFTWVTEFVSNGATASGTGKLKVLSDTSARYSISGRGTHPALGGFTITSEGNVVCAGGEGQEADGTFKFRADSGMRDEGTITLFKCFLEGCAT